MTRPSGRAGEEAGQKKARPLKDALEQYLRSSGLQDMLKSPKLHTAWQRTVGEDIAGHTRVMRMHRGVLEVGVDSSALMNDIMFHKTALLLDLRREIAKPFIQDIQFIHRTLQEDNDGNERR